MSYAIISLGGKQYRVREGERLLVDKLATDEGTTFNCGATRRRQRQTDCRRRRR
jgi:ribosomal protein L21